MKNYNYKYYGQIISRKQFLENVLEDWEDNLDEFGCFSWGGYSATLIER